MYAYLWACDWSYACVDVTVHSMLLPFLLTYFICLHEYIRKGFRRPPFCLRDVQVFTSLHTTPLHIISLHFTSLHTDFTSLHFTLLGEVQELLDLESQEEAFQVRWYATFTTLAMQCPLASWYLHFTSLHLHFTSLYFISLHFTSLHFTSPHFTSLHFTSLHFTSLHFTSLHLSILFIV